MQRLIAKAQNLRDRVEQRMNSGAGIPTSTSGRTDRDEGHDRVGVDGSGGAVVRIPVEAARRLQVS